MHRLIGLVFLLAASSAAAQSVDTLFINNFRALHAQVPTAKAGDKTVQANFRNGMVLQVAARQALKAGDLASAAALAAQVKGNMQGSGFTQSLAQLKADPKLATSVTRAEGAVESAGTLASTWEKAKFEPIQGP